MKIFSMSREAKIEAKLIWHRFFALFPVRIDHSEIRWMEFVERKGSYSPVRGIGWRWKYRVLTEGISTRPFKELQDKMPEKNQKSAKEKIEAFIDDMNGT